MGSNASIDVNATSGNPAASVLLGSTSAIVQFSTAALESIITTLEPLTGGSGGVIDPNLFRSLVFIMGMIGMIANAIVASVLGLSKSMKKEQVNILFLNQMILDLYSCTLLTAVNALRLANLYLTSSWGFWLCKLFLDELPLWIGLNGSTANLVIVAVERYLMIVHPVWHKNHIRTWMIYCAVAFTWIDGVALNVPLFIVTSGVQDGVCLEVQFWASPQVAYIYSIWYFIYFYLLAITAFFYCYGRILAVVARQARTFKSMSANGKGAGGLANQQIAYRAKVNVVKTMMTITVLFIVCWLPNTLFYLITNFCPFLWNDDVYQVSLFLAFLNISLNPFIYAGQYDVLRRRLQHFRECIGGAPGRLTSTVRPSSPSMGASGQHTKLSVRSQKPTPDNPETMARTENNASV